MKILQIGGIIAATTITAAFPYGNNPSAKPNAAIEAEMNPEWQSSFVLSAEPTISRFGIIQRRPRQTYRIPLFVPTSHFGLHKNRQRLF